MDNKLTIESFAAAHGLEMEVKERAASFDPARRFYASFKGCEVKEGAMLRGAFGDGSTREAAIADYVDEISDRKLVVGAYTSERREISVPTLHRPAADDVPADKGVPCKWNCGAMVADADECDECVAHNLAMKDCYCDPDGIAMCRKHIAEKVAYAIARLESQLQQALAQRDGYKKALEHYADEENWDDGDTPGDHQRIHDCLYIDGPDERAGYDIAQQALRDGEKGEAANVAR